MQRNEVGRISCARVGGSVGNGSVTIPRMSTCPHTMVMGKHDGAVTGYPVTTPSPESGSFSR